MAVSSNLKRLVEAVAPYWAGEAEVCRSYWSSPVRSRATDLKWLNHQCFKEIWGVGLADKKLGLFLGPLEKLRDAFPKIDIEIDRHEVLDIAEGLWAEFAHYCAFADAYDGLLEPGEPKLNPKITTWWKEDEILANLRYGHQTKYGRLGLRACRFTEGGYCTLFSEGMRLKQNPTSAFAKADQLIATACARVYDDQFGHMLKGIGGLDQENLSDADWQALADMSIEQLRGRIVMRNSQFSYPLSEDRLAHALDGRCEPLPFDFAGLSQEKTYL